MVLDPFGLRDEIESLRAKNINVDGRIVISPRAHIVLPHHKLLDGAREQAAGANKIGTTGRGIGPCYSDKAARCGLHIGDLLVKDSLLTRLQNCIIPSNLLLKHAYGIHGPSPEEVFESLLPLADYFRLLIGDVPALLWKAYEEDKAIMFEGAQGSMLDLDSGTYPFVSSSTTIASGVSSGTGFPCSLIDRSIGVVKAYTTRVGLGPFPTEITGEIADDVRKHGNEFGTTTGRPRRIGWLDAVGLRAAVRLNVVDSIFMTKLDILSGIDEIPVCVAYEIDGEIISEVPEDPHAFAEAKPLWTTMPGWKEDLRHVTKFSDLPDAAREYVGFVNEQVGIPVMGVSVGPARQQNFFV
jgi:adenylosuccinate synthase